MNIKQWVIVDRKNTETKITQGITSFIKEMRNDGIKVSKSGNEFECSNGSYIFQREVEN